MILRVRPFSSLGLISLILAFSQVSFATEAQKPLEVKGQSRNLNMMLVLRNDKDKIKFVKMREDYRDEILDQAPSQVSNQKQQKE